MPPIVRKYKTDQALFHDGDISQSIFIVSRGAVSIRKVKGDGGSIEVSKISAGGVIGELSFFDGKPRSATAIALNEVEAIEIPFEDMEKIYQSIPPYMKAIVSALAERLRIANQNVLHLQRQLEIKEKQKT